MVKYNFWKISFNITLGQDKSRKLWGFNFLVSNPELVEKKLESGSKKAKRFANKVLKRVRLKLGYDK